MINSTVVQCERCGSSFERRDAELKRTRKLGRRSFCSRSCSAKASNEPRKSRVVIKTCPHCEAEFKSSTHNKAATFCSRSCASAGSMNPQRRKAQSEGGRSQIGNLIPVHETLKRREGWKYARLRKYLGDRPHEFEYPLGGYVFDLALFDTNTLVEFDAIYHTDPKQASDDAVKDAVASSLGFTVIRRQHRFDTVFSSEVLKGL